MISPPVQYCNAHMHVLSLIAEVIVIQQNADKLDYIYIQTPVGLRN